MFSGEAEDFLTKTLKILFSVSVLLNVVLVPFASLTFLRNMDLTSNLASISLENKNLAMQMQTLRQQVDLMQKQLSFYKSQAELYASTLKGEKGKGAATGLSSIGIVAVRVSGQDSFTPSYEGVIMKAEIELRPGEGRVLIDTQPRVGIDLQSSVRTAARAAEDVTGIALQGTDIILTVKAQEAFEVVDGPSAGAAIAVALIAAITKDTVRSNVFITGTINPDGSIGQVGGVLEKALAAVKAGATTFLVPPKQTRVTVTRVERREVFPGVVFYTVRQDEVNLHEELASRGFSVKAVEVKDVKQALRFFAA